MHMPMKCVELNVNIIWRQCYELNEQSKELHIHVRLVSNTSRKLCCKYFIGSNAFRVD
jgi:hypothetical protein